MSEKRAARGGVAAAGGIAGAAPLRLPVTIGQLAGALLMAAALAILVAGWRQAASFDPAPAAVNFFPGERNEAGEYRFSYPSASLFWADQLPAGARLTLTVQSPAPLPPRALTIGAPGGELARVAVGAERRTLRLLLPRAAPGVEGYAVSLATEAAEAPGDPRRLGLLFTTLRLDAQPGAPPVAPTLLAAALIAGAAAATLSLGLGWATAGALAVILALIFRGDPGRLWLIGGWALAALVAVRVALPRPVMEWAERRPALSPPAWGAAAVGAGFTFVIGWYALENHRLYRTNGYDLGLYDQTFWLVSRLLPNFSTGAGINMIGSHAALVLYPIAALYWPMPDVRTILLLQTAAVGLAVVPLYLLGRDRGHPWLGVAAGVAYLLHPATQNMTLFDFHVDTIAATALIFAIWAADAGRWRAFAVACAVVIFCKENFTVTTAWLGVGLVLLRRQWRIGAILIAASAGWFLFSTQVLVPALIGKDESLHVSRFARYGDSVPAILLFALTNPLVVMGDLLAPGWLSYVGGLLRSFAFLPLLSPYALLALPALAINLLSGFEAQRTLLFHYNAMVVAVLAVATVDALCRAVGWLQRARPSRWWSAALIAIVLATALYIDSWVFLRRNQIGENLRSEQAQSLTAQRDYILSLIPPGAGVAAQSPFHPHLTHRQQAFIFPNPFVEVEFYYPEAIPFEPRIDYVVVDRSRLAMGALSIEDQLALLDELEERGLYRRAAALGGIVLLERVEGWPERCYGAGWRGEECQP